MDEQAQMQAIVDKLTGSVPPDSLPLPAGFDQPWRSIYLSVRRCGEFWEAEQLLVKVTRHVEVRERTWLVKQLLDMLPPDEGFTGYPSLHELSGQFADVDWLWPSWIPRGMLTLFGAAPGAGKSLVALDLARRVIHGEPFPDGTPPGDTAPSVDGVAPGDTAPSGSGRRVLIVDAEGAPALLNQRAQAWQIDSRRLFLMLAPDGGLIDLAHPEQQELFCEMCRKLGPALVVVDSLAAATARGETSLEAARAILGFLSNVAREGNHAMLLIHHLRKRSRSSAAWARRGAHAVRIAADDLRGSSHISAAARSVMALSVACSVPPTGGLAPASGVPPDLAAAEVGRAGPASVQAESRFDGPRRLEIVKTNLCRHPPPLGLVFEGENVAVPTLRYSEFVEPPPPPSQTDLCAGWLFRFLDTAGEPVRPADAIRLGVEAGYSRATVYRARNILGGLVIDQGTGPYDPHKRWTLAFQPPSPPEDRPSPQERP